MGSRTSLTTWLYETAARRAEILLGKHRLPASFAAARLRGNYAPMTMVAVGNQLADIVRPSQTRRFDDLARRRRAIARLVCGLDAADLDRSFDE